MPYVKIQISDKGGNKGSCRNLVSYLQKENENGRSIEQFFDNRNNSISSDDVIKSIDTNKAKLGKEDAKFFSLTISPNEIELNHLGGTIEEQKKKLREYTQAVMNEYAKNFNRKGIDSSKDIVYYAKIEHDRYYKGIDKEVKEGVVRQGDLKPGNNLHVHVLVSRKCAENRLKLSPLTNHRKPSKGAVKGGFDRTEFKSKCEILFDDKYQFNRELRQTFKYMNTMKNGTMKEKLKLLERDPSKEKDKTRKRSPTIEKEERLKKANSLTKEEIESKLSEKKKDQIKSKGQNKKKGNELSL